MQYSLDLYSKKVYYMATTKKAENPASVKKAAPAKKAPVTKTLLKKGNTKPLKPIP